MIASPDTMMNRVESMLGSATFEYNINSDSSENQNVRIPSINSIYYLIHMYIAFTYYGTSIMYV